jgi:hypothetical protein
LCLCGTAPRAIDCMKAASGGELANGYVCRREAEGK